MRRSSPLVLALALVCPLVVFEGAARASEGSSGDTSADRAADRAEASRVRFGALAGIGFPRPLALEAMVRIGRVAALGAEYGVLPQTTFDGVNVSLWSIAGDARVFPFGGPFFLGVRAGRQHLDASASAAVPGYGTMSGAVALDSWFVNPRLGLLWTARSGLTFGIEAGVQIPLTGDLTSTVPLSLDPSLQSTLSALGQSALPTVDLLRVGMLM